MIPYRDHPIQGYVVYDGPCYADNIWFGGFKSTENYTSAAIGFQKKNKAFSSPVSAMTNMQFGFNDVSILFFQLSAATMTAIL